MIVYPGHDTARLMVNDRLVAAREACQKLIDELGWVSSHFKIDWSYADACMAVQHINSDIKKLWKMSDEEVQALYKHRVSRRVLD